MVRSLLPSCPNVIEFVLVLRKPWKKCSKRWTFIGRAEERDAKTRNF